MNNLLFVDHMALGLLDTNVWRSEIFKDYMSLYRRFPVPPGIEYIVPRNRELLVDSPWGKTSSNFPLPEYRSISFQDAADSFGASVAAELDQGKQAYIFWSGGIDSTCVAVSVLKHLQPRHQTQVTIVMSDASARENPRFYEAHLKHFAREEFESFSFANIDVSNIIVLDGEGGDQIFGSSLANYVFSLYPDKINVPWRSEVNLITKLLRKPWDTTRTWEIFYNMVVDSIDASAPVESLQEFFWWLNFNFKFDAVMTRTLLFYGASVNDHEFKQFATTSTRRLFAHKEMQQWAMSSDASSKTQGGKSIKLPAKQYIYDFDKNEYYFREKRKELSTPMLNRKYFALGKDYTRYSLEDRAVRKHIRELFYPGVTGRIYFAPDLTLPMINNQRIAWSAKI